MTGPTIEQLAAALLRHVGVEPAAELDRLEAGKLRAVLETIRDGRQAPPRPTASRPVWELVVEDMHARDQLGRRRYGVPLQAGNGRDALRDAYEEALDLAVYLRQAIEERRTNGDA